MESSRYRATVRERFNNFLMKVWTLPQVKKALKALSKRGWVKSNRRHDTGIGKTLEDHLGLTENNIALPDFGVMELKSQRINTPSMLTLFTKSPEGISNSEIRKKFGYPDPEFPSVKIIHQTLDGGKKNRMGFQLKVDKAHNRLLLTKSGKPIGHYRLDFLKKQAIRKIGNGLIFVLADSKKEKDGEYFRYKEAYILKDINPAKFIRYSKYDIRLGVYHSGKNVGKPHDHGSAFRIIERAAPDLFRIKKRIL